MLKELVHSTEDDIRFAFRMMKHSFGVSAVAILSLGLGIGATIAIFSVIYALALRPLPAAVGHKFCQNAMFGTEEAGAFEYTYGASAATAW